MSFLNFNRRQLPLNIQLNLFVSQILDHDTYSSSNSFVNKLKFWLKIREKNILIDCSRVNSNYPELVWNSSTTFFKQFIIDCLYVDPWQTEWKIWFSNFLKSFFSFWQIKKQKWKRIWKKCWKMKTKQKTKPQNLQAKIILLRQRKTFKITIDPFWITCPRQVPMWHGHVTCPCVTVMWQGHEISHTIWWLMPYDCHGHESKVIQSTPESHLSCLKCQGLIFIIPNFSQFICNWYFYMTILYLLVRL